VTLAAAAFYFDAFGDNTRQQIAATATERTIDIRCAPRPVLLKL
jgi:hypothetical protein